MMYYVYILYSKEKDRYYIGQTENVEKRLNEHRVRKNLGATEMRLFFTHNTHTKRAYLASQALAIAFFLE
jgi:predicted GIY-YIG superfamily endonuclease